MNKSYQMNDAAAMGLAAPESVTLAMAELAGDVQEGLLAMAVGTGPQRTHPGAAAYVDGAAPGRVAHVGSNAALDQQHRVDDLDRA